MRRLSQTPDQGKHDRAFARNPLSGADGLVDAGKAGARPPENTRHATGAGPSSPVGPLPGLTAATRCCLCAREDAFDAFDLALSDDLARSIDGLIERHGRISLRFSDGTELELADLGVLLNPRRMVATLQVAGLETRRPDPEEYRAALTGVLPYVETDAGEPMATQDIAVQDADADADTGAAA